MNEPIAVLLIIGGLTLGPFWEKPEDADTIRIANQNINNGDGTWKWTMPQILCRKMMHEVGVGWRMSLFGDVGWMESDDRDWLGRRKTVEVRCVVAPPGFRAHADDPNVPSEIVAGCTDIRVDPRHMDPRCWGARK